PTNPRNTGAWEALEKSPFSSRRGYSAAPDQITAMEKSSGIPKASPVFRPKELPGRNIVEVELDVTVNGDYKAVVEFLNGLQRSHNFYIIDGLTLGSEQTGQNVAGALRVVLHLRSYFKNAA